MPKRKNGSAGSGQSDTMMPQQNPATSNDDSAPDTAPHTLHLPVRHLTEFLLRGGSIDSRFSGVTGIEGSRAHRRLQRRGGAGYTPEVSLATTEQRSNFIYQLSGRADGVIERNGEVTVDEIKTTVQQLDTLTEDGSPAHWGQGRIYAYILCKTKNLPGAGVQLRYYNIETDEVRSFTQRYTAKELADFMDELLAAYQRWAELSVQSKQKRDVSLRALRFPFGDYRAGQREMAVASYNTFQNGGRLFCCAPTGIGKTISTLFPAMKALGEGHGNQIFYLTAKTVARKAAEDTLDLLRGSAGDAGAELYFRSITLTAKDKACFLEKRACLPEVCQWADGYYDRLNDAMYEILSQGRPFSREALEQAANHYRLCPYELSLDLALWCDCIICDYNYLFDPVVHLQRFFETGGGDYLFLVDEAHNLVNRSREMYSAQLGKGQFFAFKKQLPKANTRLHRALAGLNTAFITLRKQCQAEGLAVLQQDALPRELSAPLERFVAAAEAFLEEHKGSQWEEELLALYFDALFYQRIAEEYDEKYITLLSQNGSEVVVRLFCMDAAPFLEQSLDLGRAAVLFSATLQPLPYYRETLGGGPYAKLLDLESPFPQENLALFVAGDISTRYTDRAATTGAVAEMLAHMAEAKQGNYMACFPSYSYLRAVHQAFAAAYPHIPTQVQTGGMDEAAREEFLAAFDAQRSDTLLSFCVMGGIFSEGVDLVGDRLLGVAVVGVGLPQIGPEPDAVRRYFDEKSGNGFAYAYQFPGMNKVLQAAGRVIRTERDRGVVLLIDSRFPSRRYQEMFPAHWGHWQHTNARRLPTQLHDFWGGEPGTPPARTDD